VRLSALFIPATLALCTPALGASAPSVTHVFPALFAAIGDYEQLDAEYESAFEAWKVELDEAEGLKARRALRDSHPAKGFWPRFEALADGGSGRALLWLAGHVRENGVKSRKRAEVLRPLYEKLAAEHAKAAWFPVVLDQFAKDQKRLEDDFIQSFYATVVEKGEDVEVRAQALAAAASALLKADAEGAAERAEAMRARIEKEFPGTLAAKELERVRANEAVQVGRVAPDFDAETIDGFEFKLSDYRGKVVVLDFYGFW
jgi:hypothetical protein